MKRVAKSRARSHQSDFNRQRIVDSARVHFFRHGFRSVTMDDLAQELAISKKTLYAHFPGKIELLEAVLADKFAGVEAKLKEVGRAHTHRGTFRQRCTHCSLIPSANWMKLNRHSFVICGRKRRTCSRW